MNFHVVTDHTLGVGAIYDWKVKIFGIPILKFEEKVVEWQDGKSVAYQAISGWKMFFRIDLAPKNGSTVVKVEIDFSLPFPFFGWLLRPLVEFGLNKVGKRGLNREDILTK